MRFAARWLLLSLFIICVLCVLHTFFSSAPSPRAPPHSPYNGSLCHHQGRTISEGTVFSERCRDCYCSFGKVECAVAHCKNVRNTLGMDLIIRDVQIIIHTSRPYFPGTVAVMNSVLKHTAERVKFTIILYSNMPRDGRGDDLDHLHLWIQGTPLRYSNYVIVVAKKAWFESDSYADMKLGEEDYSDDLKTLFKRLIYSPWSALLFLNTILPLEHRVIVLGNSVIVKGDIADLFNMDLKGRSTGVINSCIEVTPSHIIPISSYFRNDYFPNTYQIPESACSFSRNLLVVDLDKWYSYQTERQLSLILHQVMVRKGDLTKQDIDTLSFLPILLRYWNVAMDLNSEWRVGNMWGRNVSSVDEGGDYQILNWEHEHPWESQPAEWLEYYLHDSTGLFRLERVLPTTREK